MLNVHDLEKRWKSYKIKSFLPYFIITMILFISIPIVYIFYTNDNANVLLHKSIIQKKNLPPIAVTKEENKTIPAIKNITTKKSLIIQKVPLNKEIQTLQPSMDFMQNIQHTSAQPQYIKQQNPKKRPTAKKIRKKVKPKIIQEVIQDITPEVTPTKKEPKVVITIERKETKNDIYEIIKRFKNNNNPALSLFVAKKYYELGNYGQSYNYALITNQINSNIEASWIVFAKSLVKLHKKDKAIQTLKEYIKVSHSSNAEILLNEITSGRFK